MIILKTGVCKEGKGASLTPYAMTGETINFPSMIFGYALSMVIS